MTVAVAPKREKIEANSMPTAPAPMTTRLLGISWSSRISSDVTMDFPSGVIPGRLRGREPVARMTAFVEIFVSPASPLTITVLPPSRRPWPLKSVILFFLKRYPSIPLERRVTMRFLRAMTAAKSMATLSARMP